MTNKSNYIIKYIPENLYICFFINFDITDIKNYLLSNSSIDSYKLTFIFICNGENDTLLKGVSSNTINNEIFGTYPKLPYRANEDDIILSTKNSSKNNNKLKFISFSQYSLDNTNNIYLSA